MEDAERDHHPSKEERQRREAVEEDELHHRALCQDRGGASAGPDQRVELALDDLYRVREDIDQREQGRGGEAPGIASYAWAPSGIWTFQTLA